MGKTCCGRPSVSLAPLSPAPWISQGLPSARSRLHAMGAARGAVLSAGWEEKALSRVQQVKEWMSALKKENKALQQSLWCRSGHRAGTGSRREGTALTLAGGSTSTAMQHPLTRLPSLQLRAQEEQSQGLWQSLARLQEELGATCVQKQQSLQQLSGAKETIQDLQQEVASNRKHLAELLQQVRAGTGQPKDAASHHAALSARAPSCFRAALAPGGVGGGAPACPRLCQPPSTLPAPQLCMQVRDMATLQAELAQAQQEKAKQEEKIAAYEEQRQQLHWELRKMQGAQEQSKQEVSMSQAFPRGTRSLCSACVSLTARLCHQQAHSLQEKLQELSRQAQHWQQLQQDSERALAMQEEELVVCKVELAFLKEELRKAKEQVQDRNRQHHSPRAGAQAGPLAPGNDRSLPTGRAEVERTGQGTAYCRSHTTKGSGSRVYIFSLK